jgi:D-apionate oxidoisomerase
MTAGLVHFQKESMTSIALLGAGGKMGARLAKNLQGSAFEIRHVEVSAAGQQRLKDELGIACCSLDDALRGVDAVILAVPDTLIGRIAAEISPQLAPGTMVITLDAAAPFAGHLPKRDDLVYLSPTPATPTSSTPKSMWPVRRTISGVSGLRNPS